MSDNNHDTVKDTEISVVDNFIHDLIDEDLEKGVYDHVHTRFPLNPMVISTLDMLSLFV